MPVLQPTQFVAKVCEHCVDAKHVQSFLNTSRMHLIDARSPDRYRGENETIDPVGGHIPGAVNRFFRDNLQVDGRFKPADVLRAEWLDILAGRASDTVVHQCGSGVSACHNLLAMEIAGLSGSRLYAGSWSEWCSDSGRPVA
jgi:thiosulfate/3-mercaptopyruvate sulfurtransferase